MSIQKSSFGTHPDGSTVDLFTLENGKGLRCAIMTLGGIITELHVPDRNGNSADIALGLPTLQDYLNGHPHLGALTGRVAGRINGGKFTLEGKTYELELNDPPNHLHGGPEGIDKRNWKASTDDSDPANPTLTLSYHSPDGEMGYPGNVDFTVTYKLSDDNALEIHYQASTDAPTPLSLTNHSYFNLKGEGSDDLEGHSLQIYTDTYIPKDDIGTLSNTPTSVAGTPHDFRNAKSLKAFADLGQHGEHYVLRSANSSTPEKAAEVIESHSGRKMEVFTTTTAVQLYTSQTLGEAEVTGKSGKRYRDYSAFCLECQGYPNAVNAPEIEDIIVRPGTPYHQSTLYRFSAV
ncbi:galactose mutarotase [Kiritimatiellota bacterium B12222]|nr:galactose mutarotase [Kiritimatiellota bacterium B12222]